MVGRYKMDDAYALAMREEGFTYREIGIEIARREGRKVPYQSICIYKAIRRFEELLKKEIENERT